jgi:hypothetical protein
MERNGHGTINSKVSQKRAKEKLSICHGLNMQNDFISYLRRVL